MQLSWHISKYVWSALALVAEDCNFLKKDESQKNIGGLKQKRMGLDANTITTLGANGIMAVLFAYIIRWFLTQATGQMKNVNKAMVANTLVLTELYKLNLVEAAAAKGLINGKEGENEAARQYKNLLESMRSAENKIKTML